MLDKKRGKKKKDTWCSWTQGDRDRRKEKSKGGRRRMSRVRSSEIFETFEMTSQRDVTPGGEGGSARGSSLGLYILAFPSTFTQYCSCYSQI
jgi:hypothetical protein